MALVFTAIFWVFWLFVGIAAASAWLEAACPPAACNGMLILLQTPSLIINATIWLGIGIVASIAIAVLTSKKTLETPKDGVYTSGKAIQIGDRVSFHSPELQEGEVVHIPALNLIQPGYDPLAHPHIKCGFVVQTVTGELHHFLQANRGVVLLARQKA